MMLISVPKIWVYALARLQEMVIQYELVKFADRSYEHHHCHSPALVYELFAILPSAGSKASKADPKGVPMQACSFLATRAIT